MTLQRAEHLTGKNVRPALAERYVQVISSASGLLQMYVPTQTALDEHENNLTEVMFLCILRGQPVAPMT